jgi:hypothetical protein
MITSPKWNAREEAAICKLALSQELTTDQVLRQALRLYEIHIERNKAGETCVWSGDAERIAEFKGRAHE